MKITAVRPVLVTVPEPWEHGMRPSTYGFVRVETDAGIVGFGETYIAWYNPEVVPPLVEHYGNAIMGEDPLAINTLWRRMMVKSLRWGPMGPGISVLGAIEIALWDILGKVANLPVYQLLGGPRPRFPPLLHEHRPRRSRGPPTSCWGRAIRPSRWRTSARCCKRPTSRSRTSSIRSAPRSRRCGRCSETGWT